MKRTLRRVLPVLLLAGLSASLQAQRGEWLMLGDAHVDGAADHDKIKVGKDKGLFRSIQLRVEGAAIDFDRVVVHYGNGSAVPIEIRFHIPAGGVTRAIELPGERRFIDSVEIWYMRGSFRDVKPRVTLLGMH